MTLNEIKIITSICWNARYHPPTLYKSTGCYRLGLNSFFVPHSCPFKIKQIGIHPNVTEQK